MIELKMLDNLHFKVECEDREILKEVDKHFTEYAANYLFSPKYRAGHWDGKIHLFSIYEKKLPYGLLTEFLTLYKKNLSNVKLIINEDLKDFLRQDDHFDNIEIEKCEPWDYRPYQENCIRKALKYKKCIIRAATSAGKSFIIAGIIKNLLHYKKIKNAIIIVPTTSLVEQFYKDLLDYGFFKDDLGKVYSKFKEWNKKIVISTWQSLTNNKENVAPFNCVIVDEVHTARANTIRDILKISDAYYRIGCTGTMPDARLEALNVKSYLGPIVAEISASELQDLGYIANSKILMYHLNYNTKFNKDYNIAKDEIFKYPFRLNFISNLVRNLNKTVLLLVWKVETEGEFLKQYLLDQGVCPEENIVFISGEMKTADREIWRERVIKNPDEKYVMIATFGTFSAGINLPNLGHLIFASQSKSSIKILQSIGRVLRKYITKTGAVVYDLVDHSNKWFPKYGDIRLRFYDKEKFEVIEKEVKEP